MKIISQPAIYQKEHECYACKAVLLVDETDVKLGNFAVGWAGEKEDYQAYFDCGACGSQIILDDFPTYKLREMKNAIKSA